MNTLNVAVKSFACGFAALAISTVLSWSLVDSTSAVRFGIQPGAVSKVAHTSDRAHYLAGAVVVAAHRA